MLLAVDLGLRTGLATFDRAGELVAYRSQHFGTRTALRRAIFALLPPTVEALAVEGGGPIEVLWRREAERRGIACLSVHAHAWREALLLPRESRSGAPVKDTALRLARQVIAQSPAPAPTSLTDDAAEAVLLGVWACHRLGWRAALPVLRR